MPLDPKEARQYALMFVRLAPTSAYPPARAGHGRKYVEQLHHRDGPQAGSVGKALIEQRLRQA
jgi:hypothetical protein